MKKLLVLILLLQLALLHTLPVSFSVDDINFGNLQINTSESRNITIINTTDQVQNLMVRKLIPEITLSDSVFTISANGSANLSVGFTV